MNAPSSWAAAVPLLAWGYSSGVPNPLHLALARVPQGGAEDALTMADSTGSTPSQLAIEKGHRLLGLHLAEYKYRQVGAAASRTPLCVLG